MKFKVMLCESDNGFAIFCPGLNGCVSQGDTKEEALENIRDAIRLYLEAAWVEIKADLAKDAEHGPLTASVDEVEVDIEGIEYAEPQEVDALI